MTFSEYTLENTPINARPQCPKCTALMYLARITPDKPGFDLRADRVRISSRTWGAWQGTKWEKRPAFVQAGAAGNGFDHCGAIRQAALLGVID
jgi:hypothetical protein